MEGRIRSIPEPKGSTSVRFGYLSRSHGSAVLTEQSRPCQGKGSKHNLVLSLTKKKNSRQSPHARRRLTLGRRRKTQLHGPQILKRYRDEARPLLRRAIDVKKRNHPMS